jgi:hypothetical protein
MMSELGLGVEPQTIVDHYSDMLDILVADVLDRHVAIRGPEVRFAETVMRSLDDRVRLAREVLDLAARPDGGGRSR